VQYGGWAQPTLLKVQQLPQQQQQQQELLLQAAHLLPPKL
jgi:hypothetical protein